MCNRAHGNGKAPTYVDAGHFTFDPSPLARPKLGSQMAKIPHAEPYDKIMDQFSAANQCQNFQMLSKNSKLAKILLLIILERGRIQTLPTYLLDIFQTRTMMETCKGGGLYIDFKNAKNIINQESDQKTMDFLKSERGVGSSGWAVNVGI